MKDFLHNRPRVNNPGRAVDARASSSRDADAAEQAMAAFGMGALHALPTAGGGKHDATVEAIKEGDKVTKLIVTCRCGERIEILCAYGPNSR